MGRSRRLRGEHLKTSTRRSFGNNDKAIGYSLEALVIRRAALQGNTHGTEGSPLAGFSFSAASGWLRGIRGVTMR
jgi:hypothetical protein